jgi:hypothetical protein
MILIEEENQIPKWLTAAVRILVPKNQDTEDTERPKNYTQMACLPTKYKTITIICKRMQTYIGDKRCCLKKRKNAAKGLNDA